MQLDFTMLLTCKVGESPNMCNISVSLPDASPNIFKNQGLPTVKSTTTKPLLGTLFLREIKGPTVGAARNRSFVNK